MYRAQVSFVFIHLPSTPQYKFDEQSIIAALLLGLTKRYSLVSHQSECFSIDA